MAKRKRKVGRERPLTEADLSHEADPERFGRAMVQCLNSSGDCSYYGYCMFGGCFDSLGVLKRKLRYYEQVVADLRRDIRTIEEERDPSLRALRLRLEGEGWRNSARMFVRLRRSLVVTDDLPDDDPPGAA